MIFRYCISLLLLVLAFSKINLETHRLNISLPAHEKIKKNSLKIKSSTIFAHMNDSSTGNFQKIKVSSFDNEESQLGIYLIKSVFAQIINITNIFSIVIKSILDTLSSFLSTPLRIVGALLNFIASNLWDFSNFIEDLYFLNRDKNISGIFMLLKVSAIKISFKLTTTLKNTGYVLHGTGELFRWIGEAIDSVMADLGSSFRHLFFSIELVMSFFLFFLVGDIDTSPYSTERFNLNDQSPHGTNEDTGDFKPDEDLDDDQDQKNWKFSSLQFARYTIQTIENSLYLIWKFFYEKLMPFIQRYFLDPIRYITSISSIAPNLFLFLILFFLISEKSFKSKARKNRIIILFFLLFWVYIVFIEYIFMNRYIIKEANRKAYMELIKPQSLNHIDEYNVNADLRADDLIYTNKSNNLKGLNQIIMALWQINDNQVNNKESGGLRTFLGASMKETLNEQLSMMQSGAANLRFKSFDLGKVPPLLRHIEAKVKKSELLSPKQSLKPTASKFGQSLRRNSNADLTYLSSQLYLKMFQFLTTYFPKQSVDLFNNSVSSYLVAETPFSLDSSVFIVGYDRLDLLLNFTFVSQDLDIVMTMHSEDSKSAFPKTLLRIEGISLSGTLKLSLDLTTDYPFFGIGNVSYLEAPLLDFKVQSLGGFDLSSLPFAYYWANSSIQWLIAQYTTPNEVEFDFRHFICPSCDNSITYSIKDTIARNFHFFSIQINKFIVRLSDFIRNIPEKASSSLSQIKTRIAKIIKFI